MLHFDSDYMEGAHPAILERLAATNFDQTSGYGTDEVCAAARERIREACACPHANVYFLVGGTQANAAVAAWVRDNGYAFDGPAFNIYHVNPSETDDPEEYVTEVCYPVKKRA